MNPSNPDTDKDGVGDAAEVDALAAGVKDSDNDSLTDDQEATYGTNPNNPDTDGDGFKDGDEFKAGYNPKGPGRL